MCDFKPGDEVVVVVGCKAAPLLLKEGEVVTILDLKDFDDGEGLRVFLVEVDNGDEWGETGKHWFGFNPDRFRKVQRRDLTEWLAQPTDVEEPKRAPAKKRERVE